ncbi:uncharacterized protein LOC118389243 isoform X7 [Oncorhynchus keta]|uniref:uncharacterized protein LOC118389243 isoform X5 n=2 Tax=Oncorhynchus keta TaxID=8018 RepID=UPI00227BEBF8|nr:uncharacterized protein LOC118389243 isoform X5 [Oncorhynchus keta]XP_052383636.1 uncharacterized protein LOC118389243 isoform X6 [Oncorhynchus keta]XP_052383637.1 uncharacterized protein LOC118389243 isoform X7 [Oncorhynchus keta]
MDPEKHSHQREYREPKACSQRREYGGPSSGQWDDSFEKRGNGQAMPREPYSEYSSMRRTREGGKEYGASSAMSYIMYPSSRDWSKGSLRGSSGPFSPDTDGDIDGEPVVLSVEDLELARKKKELKVIEEKIARKKAVLALQKVQRRAKDMPETQAASATAKGMSKQRKVNDTTFQRYSNVADQSSRICLPLKRRVLDILSKLRRTPVQYLLHKTKKQNKMRALELMISAPLENEEAHPLRLRVKGLMNQRRSPNNEVVPDDKQHNPTIQRPVHSLRTQEKDIVATGFLNVLNEGVDLNKLSKIVNDENEQLIVGEELPQVWPTLLEGHVDYSSRSKSSPFEEKKVRLEDEQRYERMQTLLEIVGLDLGVEELGRLTDRTNDRLYGKMGDLKRDRAREGESPARERCRQRCSSTREKDRDRSERNRKGDGHRHSSTRERDKDIPVVRETNRSERNRDKDWDRDPEKDWDGGRERDRDRSRRDGGRYRSERDGDRDPEKSRDGGREKDRDRYRSERDRKREIAKDLDRWLQRTRDGDKRSRTRDWDRERSDRDRYGDESSERSIELYSYSMDPIFPVSHPHASMMATYSTTQYSQCMTYHSSPYTMAFPPGWGYPAGTMPAGIMPPGIMPPGIMPPGTMLPGIMPAGAMLPSNKPRQPNPPGYPPYTNFPPYYSNGTTALNQTYTYTQPASTRAVLSQRCTYIQPTRNRRKKTQKHARGKVSCQMVTKKSPAVLTTQIATKKSPPEPGSKIKAKGRNNIFFTGIFMKSYHSHLRKFQYYLKRLAKRRNKVHQRKRKRLLAEAAGKVAPHFPFEPEPPKKDGEKLHADTSEEVVPQEAADNLEAPSETGPKKEPEGEKLHADTSEEVVPQEAADNLEAPSETGPKKEPEGEKLHADTAEEVVPQEAADNLEAPSETGPKKEPEGEKLHADTAEEVLPQEAAKNVEAPSETGPKKEPEGEKLHADAAEKVAPQVTAMDTAAPSEMGPKKKKLYPGIFMKILMRRLKRHLCKIKGKKKHFAKRRKKAFQYKGKRPLVDTKEKVPLLEAAKDSGNPSEPWPKKKKKKKTLEEKGGIYYPGIFIRVHRTYLTRGKLAKAKAAAEGTEAISEPAPTIEGGGGMTEGKELLADTLEKGVPQVATNDSGLPPEPGPNKEPEREEETMLEDEKLLADHVAKVSVKGPQVLLEPKAEKDREGEDDASIDGEKLLADPVEKVSITGPGLLSEPETENETRGETTSGMRINEGKTSLKSST